MKEPWITRDQAAGKSEQDLSALVDLEWVISNTAEEAYQIWVEQSYVDSKARGMRSHARLLMINVFVRV